MAKTATKSQELAPTKTNLPADADLGNLLDEYAGAGTSSKAEHVTIPLVYVLQSNSPQAIKRNPAYVEGAEPGDLWFRNAAQPIHKGTDGVLFQPCHFDWAFVEWKPEREGFVAAHKTRPADAKEKLEDASDPDSRLQWVRPNGNIVVDTCYVYGLVDMERPYVIPLSSTGYRVAKDWNTDLLNRKHNGKPLPVFGTKYELRTVLRSNKKGEWFILGFDFVPGLPTAEEVKRGLAFFKAVSAGEQRAEEEIKTDTSADHRETLF